MGSITLLPMEVKLSLSLKRTTILQKLEFLALKWAVTKHFREYLQYSSEPFLIRTDNNPLTYVMTTPNLNAIGHHWVRVLANYNFNIEYLKGHDNSAANILSRMTECLEDDDMKCLLDGITIRAANQAELHNPLMQQVEIEDNIHINAVRLTNTGPKGKINVVDWAQAQHEDPELEIAIRWIKADRTSSLRVALGELADTKDGLALISRQKHLVIINNKLYVRATPPGDVTKTKLFMSSHELIGGEQ